MKNPEWLADRLKNGWRRNTLVLPPEIYKKVIAYRDALMFDYKTEEYNKKLAAKLAAKEALKGEQ